MLLLFNTSAPRRAARARARMVPGPPSTGVAIAMDGGMADTACYYTGRYSVIGGCGVGWKLCRDELLTA